MLTPRIPHFDFPFHFDATSSSFGAVEQDSLDDVFNCVHATMRTHPRQRGLLPEFGVLDLTFNEQRISLAELQAEILRWEPRALVAFDQDIDSIDELKVHITEYVMARNA